MDIKQIKSLIERRRRQILVHSIIYYRFNDNMISDAQWSKWAVELEDLQKKYPDIAKECCYAEEFKDFDHSTGQNLPLEDPWGVKTASYLLCVNKYAGDSNGYYSEDVNFLYVGKEG